VLECEQPYVDAHCQGTALHCMSAFQAFCSERSYTVFLVLQYTSDISVALVVWILPSELLSCPRKQMPSAFWQADIICLNFFDLFGECACIHCFDCSLISTFTNETQVSSPVMMWLRNSSLSLLYCSKKSQSPSHSLHFVSTYEQFWNLSCAYIICDSIA
jgi:hypothetical protein